MGSTAGRVLAAFLLFCYLMAAPMASDACAVELLGLTTAHVHDAGHDHDHDGCGGHHDHEAPDHAGQGASDTPEPCCEGQLCADCHHSPGISLPAKHDLISPPLSTAVFTDSSPGLCAGLSTIFIPPKVTSVR